MSGEAETIVRIASRGEGVTGSGRHVRLTAPGDRVEEGGAIVPGSHRQVPPCRHFPECGGCQLQHVDDAAYSAFIVQCIEHALAAQGLSGVTMRTPHLSPPRSRRRATLRGEATGRGAIVGFNAGASHAIVDMRECHILRHELFALVAPLRTLLTSLAKRREQASAVMSLTDQGVALSLTGVQTEGLTAIERLTGFAREQGLARLVVDLGYGPETFAQEQAVTVTLGGVPVAFPEGGFVQATANGEDALIAAVRDAFEGTEKVADLFAGLGTFALSLPQAAVAVEGMRDAALALTAASNAVQRGLAVEHRDLFRRPLTAAELERFDGVVLDPPRAGAKEQVGELARSGVRRIAYVSCNPATFARDARVLADGGYQLAWVRPVGQFRWSTHVELVGAFGRA